MQKWVGCSSDGEGLDGPCDKEGEGKQEAVVHSEHTASCLVC